MFRSIITSSFRRNLTPSSFRCISTTHPAASWMDKVKGVFTGNKTESAPTLLQFAEQMRTAKKLANFSNTIEKQEAVIRYLAGVDPTGENIQTSHKIDATKQCNCSMADVESVLSKFMWAKQAHIKIEQLKAEGKPIPKTMAEIQKMMGSSPLDVAKSNLAKSGQMSRNAPCPCGSKKLYKRCCGKEKT